MRVKFCKMSISWWRLLDATRNSLKVVCLFSHIVYVRSLVRYFIFRGYLTLRWFFVTFEIKVRSQSSRNVIGCVRFQQGAMVPRVLNIQYCSAEYTRTYYQDLHVFLDEEYYKTCMTVCMFNSSKFTMSETYVPLPLFLHSCRFTECTPFMAETLRCRPGRRR